MEPHTRDVDRERFELTIERANAQNHRTLIPLFDAVPPLQLRSSFPTHFHRALAKHCATNRNSITLIGFRDKQAVGYCFALTDRRRFFLTFAIKHPLQYLIYLGGHTVRTVVRRLTSSDPGTKMPLLTTRRGESPVYMQTTGTHPSVRRIGIGSTLKAAMVETARREGHTILYSQMQSEKDRWAGAANRDGWCMERQKDGTFMGVYVIKRDLNTDETHQTL